MHFSIVIPVFNAGSKIEKTLSGILAQSSILDGRDSFNCIVVDGASGDDTLEHVARFQDDRITVISEPDKGMYDALAKGLAQTQGDVTTYLPAGEFHDPHAFATVSEVLTRFPDITWLTGRSVTRNADGVITDSFLPHPFQRRYIECGMYGTRLPALQQESTFWRSPLTQEIDLDALRPLKLAGDYFIWKSFAKNHELYVINSHLGAFSIEQGQLSQQVPGAYRKELRTLRRSPTVFERASALIHRLRTKHKRPKKSAPRLIQYDHDTARWVMKNKG